MVSLIYNEYIGSLEAYIIITSSYMHFFKCDVDNSGVCNPVLDVPRWHSSTFIFKSVIRLQIKHYSFIFYRFYNI